MIDYYQTKSQPITRVMVIEAYRKVRANKGNAGIDEMSWADLDNNREAQLYKLWNRLTSGTYFPPPVKEVEINKATGAGVRKLGIPTILDRIAQAVVKTHLERMVEPHFHEHSYGYRPGKSCHQAVEKASQNAMTNDWVIDLDIKGFFDNIDHELLLKAVTHYCADKWVLLYITRWLKAGIVQQNGMFVDRENGTPQGGVISPLLANIFLHVVFDKWMEKTHPEKPFERYADDIVVHCKTEKQALFVLKQIQQRMTDCKLMLHPVKTKVINLRGKTEKKYPHSFDFLGFTIRPLWSKTSKGNKLMVSNFMSTKSKTRVLAKFSSFNIHKWRKPLEAIAQKLRPVIQGVLNYYGKFWTAHMYKVWYELNQRLLKWVKWEKGLYRKAAIKWLKQKYKEQPCLFPHWRLVHP
ncbi:group II intron reverse transcriptase/maturase [Hanamia caeni]|uniref:Group II intron reverse transcriptase/maturase n=2 Tax=Hanamia caeni TaxID=2294116 RepID=A0A3M9N1T3_9BACT|nr:group II intron reverse transcriptase/maturase [Hanamia caeni]